MRTETEIDGPLAVTLLVTEALESLDVPYVIGGSLASAVHGVARATMDVDVVADLQLAQVDGLVSLLGEIFYADREMIRGAVSQRRSFNLVHLETMFKVDVFIPKARAFDQQELARRTYLRLSAKPERWAYVASAEDVVLAKLEWYRKGDEVSDRQWQDVLGILEVQAGRLDQSYLRRWARELGVSDLLDRAFDDVGA